LTGTRLELGKRARQRAVVGEGAPYVVSECPARRYSGNV
jgi:hypothetical protein